MSWKSEIRSSTFEWFNFSIYAGLIHAVLLLFWCVCLSEGQSGRTPLPWLMRWVNSWANANLFSDARGVAGGVNLPHLAVSSLPYPPTLAKGTDMYNIKIQRQFALTGMFMKSVNHPVILNIHRRSFFLPSFSFQKLLDFRACLTRRWYWISFLRSNPNCNI